MNDQLTLAVIGHVDHGKTALVRALTGVDTDRLAEEKARGLSIVLGFSYLERPGGGIVDFIDAPGHEDFVRTMISGATGVDGALLVVAANEGVMPQTREHLDIADLLGLDRGIVVINKADLVSEEARERVRAEIRSLVAGTFLADAPFIDASALTAGGVDPLREALVAMEPVTRAKSADDQFFLPIDRAFVMRGFGPVVTGTLRAGEMRPGGDVEILPDGLTATVRGVQVHNAAVERARPGERVAVNLRNVKAEQLRRGLALARPGTFEATRRIDAELALLAHESTPLKNGAVVRLLVGTSEAMATIRLLDRDRIEPGGSGLVQLRLDRPVATPRNERFVVRTYSPARTIGGGRVLDASPARHKRFDLTTTARLGSMVAGDAAAMVRDRLVAAGTAGIAIADLRKALDLEESAISGALENGGAVQAGGRYFDASVYASLCDSIAAAVDAHHEQHPRQLGAPLASVSSGIGGDMNKGVFQLAVDALVEQGTIVRDGSLLRRADFDPLADLPPREQDVARELEALFRDAGLEAPEPTQIVGRDRLRQDLFRLLSEMGQLVRLKTRDRQRQMVLHRQTLDGIEQTLRTRFADSSGFALSEIRDVLGSTRKYVVPLMEHLDAMGVTIRKGDLRQLRSSGGE